MEKKIKVLHVIGLLRTGGAENVGMNILRYIDKNKFQCDFVVFGNNTGNYEKEAVNLGSNIYHIPEPKEGYVIYLKNLINIIKSEKYDIVHAHMLFNNGLTLLGAKFCGVKKRISHSHSTNSGRQEEKILFKVYKFIMRKMIKKYSTVNIACGLEAGKFLYGKDFIRNEGIIINNGINLNSFSYNLNVRNKIRKEMKLEKNFVLGHIGRLSKVKNHTFLLDVFYEILKLRSDSKLLIVGDGESRNQIEEKILELNLTGKVIIAGTREDVNEILQGIDIMVFPSLYEGVPLTLIEAQATGLPCLISSNISREVKITDLITFISLKENAEIWAKHIINLTSKVRKDKTKELLSQGYDINHTIKDIEVIYCS